MMRKSLRRDLGELLGREHADKEMYTRVLACINTEHVSIADMPFEASALAASQFHKQTTSAGSAGSGGGWGARGAGTPALDQGR